MPSPIRLPKSGSWDLGRLYEQPMSAHVTDGSGSSSSLLPTPTTLEIERRGSDRSDELLLAGQVKNLPTPTSRDHKGRNQRNDASCLPGALLPTPDVVNGRNATANRSNPDSSHHSGTTLQDVAYADPFGEYAPAIERHEFMTGRPAPAPLEDGRLSPAFVEWMMGLPVGHVTDTPVSRSAQLRALGNGVVPQQALAALEQLDPRED